MQGFENEEQEREFWAVLRQRSLPLKFAYVGDAAFTHDRLAQQSTYKELAGAIDVEMRAIKGHCDHTGHPPQQLCDVGPGNGVQSVEFLEAFSRSGYKLDKYLGLDFSKTLLNIGIKRIKEHFPDLKVDSAIWDFEKAPTSAISKWRIKGSTLVTMTGLTLGNPDDPLQVLKNLRNSCVFDDILVLGVALMYECDSEIFIREYTNDIFKAAALEPLKMAGINIEEGDFHLHFSKAMNAVIAEFICGTDITIEYKGEKIRFSRGESIHCFTSRRFADIEMKKLLHEAGWGLLNIAYDEGKTHAVYVSAMEHS
ncbi:L-histidine N(alpha)-methyltransferase [Candidatus Bathyarchaeota archaeon]|nr:L-histidine N(alpha)-methyltransferase [Candidatus Bathyarchaeota archaeon]